MGQIWEDGATELTKDNLDRIVSSGAYEHSVTGVRVCYGVALADGGLSETHCSAGVETVIRLSTGYYAIRLKALAQSADFISAMANVESAIGAAQYCEIQTPSGINQNEQARRVLVKVKTYAGVLVDVDFHFMIVVKDAGDMVADGENQNAATLNQYVAAGNYYGAKVRCVPAIVDNNGTLIWDANGSIVSVDYDGTPLAMKYIIHHSGYNVYGVILAQGMATLTDDIMAARVDSETLLPVGTYIIKMQKDTGARVARRFGFVTIYAYGIGQWGSSDEYKAANYKNFLMAGNGDILGARMCLARVAEDGTLTNLFGIEDPVKIGDLFSASFQMDFTKPPIVIACHNEVDEAANPGEINFPVVCDSAVSGFSIKFYDHIGVSQSNAFTILVIGS